MNLDIDSIFLKEYELPVKSEITLTFNDFINKTALSFKFPNLKRCFYKFSKERLDAELTKGDDYNPNLLEFLISGESNSENYIKDIYFVFEHGYKVTSELNSLKDYMSSLSSNIVSLLVNNKELSLRFISDTLSFNSEHTLVFQEVIKNDLGGIFYDEEDNLYSQN